MLREEYLYSDMSDYLLSTIDLLISGEPREEKRCSYFFHSWKGKNKPILTIKLFQDNTIDCKHILDQNCTSYQKGDVSIQLVEILKKLDVSKKRILIDITSLDHISIMVLTHILLKQIRPRYLFAGYISPLKYIGHESNYRNTLTIKTFGITAVPGFAKPEKNSEVVCAFLGFEGGRFKNVIEYINNANKIIPIIAFPSGNPAWFNTAIWNSMDIIDKYLSDGAVYKCSSESVFEALSQLNNILLKDDGIVLIPLGTRPHSMACAIFACQHHNVRIIYDYAVESEKRSEGIANTNIYNLTNFIDSV